MKALRNQDGTYTVQMSEREMTELCHAAFNESMLLILKRSADPQIRAYEEATSDLLMSMGKEFNRAFDTGWVNGRRAECA